MLFEKTVEDDETGLFKYFCFRSKKKCSNDINEPWYIFKDYFYNKCANKVD